MEGTYHLIVRKPYDDIPREFLLWLSANVDDYVIAQHDADEEIKSTHCHIMFVNLKVTNKALDKQRQKHKIDGDISRLLKHVVGTRDLYDTEKLSIYVLKGNRDVLKSTSYSNEFIDKCIESWIEPKKLEKVNKEKLIKYDEYDELKKDFTDYYNGMNKPHITLDGIRSWTMRWYWKRDGRMPPATSYKRNAASLYVFATELSNGSIDCAFEELKNLWY